MRQRVRTWVRVQVDKRDVWMMTHIHILCLSFFFFLSFTLWFFLSPQFNSVESGIVREYLKTPLSKGGAGLMTRIQNHGCRCITQLVRACLYMCMYVVWCSVLVLQRVAERCIVLQCVPVYDNVLWCVSVGYGVSQCVVVYCGMPSCSALQCGAVCCRLLPSVTRWYSVL